MGLPAVPAARVRIPAARGFARPRLLARLDGLVTTRLGLVCAPAGSGKTTLMAAWADRFAGSTAWYRAEAVDGTRSGLAACIAAALHAGVGRRVRLDVPSTDELAAAIWRIGEPVLLVLDDLHELADSTAMAELEQLLIAAPDNLAVLIGSRVMPPINLARLELPRPVMVLGDDLRFRSWEVEGLFRDFYSEPLRPDDAAALARRTDGWAAALQLFHLATLGGERESRTVAVHSLTGRSRYAQQYLSGQVLAALPEHLREFMRRTCVFDVLTAARCDALLGGTDGQRNLEEIERRQALTTTDDGGTTFRYHEVLRRNLQSLLLEELGEHETRAWHARAADILEDEDAVAEALQARCRAADWTGVARLLKEDGRRLLDSGGPNWVELLPPWLTQGDPWVALAEARHLLDDGQLAAADAAARRALDLFPGEPGKDLCREVIRIAGTWLHRPAPQGRTWIDLLRAATLRNPAGQVRASTRLDPAHAELVTGIALLLAGDISSGADALASLARTPGRDPRLAVAARLILAGFGALLATDDGSAAELDAVCTDAERAGYTWFTRLARGLLLAAEHRLDDADKLAAECAERGAPWAAALIRGGVALVRLRGGGCDADTLEALIDELRALDADVLVAWARAARALVLAAADAPEAEHEVRAAESFARAAAVPGAVALGHVALATLRPAESAELLELARSTGSGHDALTDVVTRWPWLGYVPPARAGPDDTVQLTCFKAFAVRIGGVVWQPTGVRPRARTLLRLLALHCGQAVHRDRLAASLWPTMAEDTAMHNLQVAISSLRKVCTGPALTIDRDGDSYRLVLGGNARSDVQHFEAHLSAAVRARGSGDPSDVATHLRAALDCYAGDLLPEDGAAEWVVPLRERYRTMAVGAAADLAELELNRGQFRAAVAAAERGVDLDRFHDGCWRALIRAHERLGDLAAAEQARAGYRTVLDSLGLAQ